MYPKMQDLVHVPTTCTRNCTWAQGRESERLVPAMVDRYRAMAAMVKGEGPGTHRRARAAGTRRRGDAKARGAGA